MILTCPECATSYFVDDARIPPAGRKVKCANCGARWTATLDPPPADLDPQEVSPEPAAVIAPEVIAEPIPEDAAIDAVFDDLDVGPATPAIEEGQALRPRRIPGAPQAPVKAAPSRRGLIALVVLAVVVLALAVVILLRGAIAHAVPATAALFEAVGLKAPATDLAVEGVHSQAAFQGETPVLSVTGAVRNSGPEAMEAPPIRVRLLDRAGKIVAVRTAMPVEAAIPAGSTRYFAIIVPSPPATAASLEVDFAPATSKEAAPPAKAEASAHPAPTAEAPAARHE